MTNLKVAIYPGCAKTDLRVFDKHIEEEGRLSGRPNPTYSSYFAVACFAMTSALILA